MKHQRQVYPRETLWRRLIVTQLILVCVLVAFTIDGDDILNTGIRVGIVLVALATLVYEVLQWRWEEGGRR